jgi:hypothetical protein
MTVGLPKNEQARLLETVRRPPSRDVVFKVFALALIQRS